MADKKIFFSAETIKLHCGHVAVSSIYLIQGFARDLLLQFVIYFNSSRQMLFSAFPLTTRQDLHVR